MKKQPTRAVRLRQIRQRRYKANKKVGVRQFKIFSDCDLMQKILRQIAPERLPPRVDDNSYAELQHAYSGYMTEEWLGAWADVFEYGARHARLLCIAGSATLTVDAIVATRRHTELPNGLRYQVSPIALRSVWHGVNRNDRSQSAN